MRKYLFLCFLGLTWAKSQYPSNYLEEGSSNQVRDEATVELDTVLENCEDYEFSKCPGFLDVCCKDPDFIPPPPLQ